MITAVSIAGGETYLSKHLSANDYYAEGETVEGEWVGRGAQRLGLDGAVEAEHFEALRNNLHPFTGERLTARKSEVARVANKRTGKVEERRAIALHDITFNAPKAASIAAIVGGDNRIQEAWQHSVRLAVKEMEHFAAVRLRTGNYRNSEKLRITGNLVGALFFHDASRSLDPQLHAHLVLPNASHDAERGHWLALQRRAMLEASPYVREFLYHDFARKLTHLGYQIESEKGTLGFQIAGITKEAEQAFSERARQRLAFEERYRRVFGHPPSKRRIEQFIKDNRGAAEVRFQAEYRTIKTAISSGIDQALWDITGKCYGVPVYKLLGGPTRERVRVYGRVSEETGVNAMKVGPPASRTAFKYIEGQKFVDEVAERFKALRDKHGSGVDIGLDFHGAVQPPTALLLMKALEPYHPWFYEEIVQALNIDVMAELAKKTHIPIATGERIFTKWGFKEILEKRAATILQPDPCYAGGITEMKIIAGMAEAYYTPLAPHNPQGPCSLAASLQIAASIPNFLIMERGDNEYADLLAKPLAPVTKGHRPIPTDPGLGITIDEDKLMAQVGEPRPYRAQFDPDDGSVVDW